MPGLEKELENVSRNVSSLSKSGDVFAEQEDQIADQISSMKQRSVQHSTLVFTIMETAPTRALMTIPISHLLTMG